MTPNQTPAAVSLEELRKLFSDYLWGWTDYRPGENKSIDAEVKNILDNYMAAVQEWALETIPKGGQIPVKARTKIRGGWYKKGWQDAVDEQRRRVMGAEEGSK